MEGSSNNKNFIKYLVLVILILVGGYYLFSYFNQSQVEIYKFSGELVNVEGNMVTLYGVFVGPIDSVPERLSEPRSLSFLVGEATTFRKLETFMPSWESIMAMGTTTETGAIITSYSSSDLVNLEGEGSIEDLATSIQRGAVSVDVDFDSSIHKSQTQVATHVSYHVLVSPEFVQPSTQ